jgi:hypothetical protein
MIEVGLTWAMYLEKLLPDFVDMNVFPCFLLGELTPEIFLSILHTHPIIRPHHHQNCLSISLAATPLTVQMEAVFSSDTLMSTYVITCCRHTEDYRQRGKSPKRKNLNYTNVLFCLIRNMLIVVISHQFLSSVNFRTQLCPNFAPTL